MHPDIAFAILSAIIAVEVVVWAVATKAAWRAITDTILFVGFSVGAILAFLVIASKVQDTRIIAGLFITLCILSLLMAEAFRR
jgi:surfactin synthase thioesterase subunit